MRLAEDFFTAELAPRIARESEPVRARIEFATSRHCLLRFGDFTLLCFETSLTAQGKTLPPLLRSPLAGLLLRGPHGLAQEGSGVVFCFVLWRFVFFSHTACFAGLHRLPPTRGRRRRAELLRDLVAMVWAVGDASEAPSPSAAEEAPDCPSRSGLRLPDLALPVPPRAERACARASSADIATRLTVRPGSSFLVPR